MIEKYKSVFLLKRRLLKETITDCQHYFYVVCFFQDVVDQGFSQHSTMYIIVIYIFLYHSHFRSAIQDCYVGYSIILFLPLSFSMSVTTKFSKTLCVPSSINFFLSLIFFKYCPCSHIISMVSSEFFCSSLSLLI